VEAWRPNGGGVSTNGRIVVDEHQVMETWRPFYENLSNEELPIWVLWLWQRVELKKHPEHE